MRLIDFIDRVGCDGDLGVHHVEWLRGAGAVQCDAGITAMEDRLEAVGSDYRSELTGVDDGGCDIVGGRSDRYRFRGIRSARATDIGEPLELHGAARRN